MVLASFMIDSFTLVSPLAPGLPGMIVLKNRHVYV